LPALTLKVFCGAEKEGNYEIKSYNTQPAFVMLVRYVSSLFTQLSFIPRPPVFLLDASHENSGGRSTKYPPLPPPTPSPPLELKVNVSYSTGASTNESPFSPFRGVVSVGVLRKYEQICVFGIRTSYAFVQACLDTWRAICLRH
jgi:hypothetical protein